MASLINPFIIKDVLNSYQDPSSFSNYQKICKDYSKLYSKVSKKLSETPKEKIRSDVKNWFFSQSLENRIKICSIENSFLCQMIYQMYLNVNIDKSMKFTLNTKLTEVYEKKFIEEDTGLYNFDNFFHAKCELYSSFVNHFNMIDKKIYIDEESESDRKYNSNIHEFLFEIKFINVHDKSFPDCICLSPSFLLKEERFDATFNYLGSNEYFHNLIEPFCSIEKSIYSYKLPNWICCTEQYSITQMIFALMTF